MRLLELVRGDDTRQEVIDCQDRFCDARLGKGVVLCNDTPGFLGNRVGVFAIQTALHAAFRLGLKPEATDASATRAPGVAFTASEIPPIPRAGKRWTSRASATATLNATRPKLLWMPRQPAT